MDRRQFFKRTTGALAAVGLLRNVEVVAEKEQPISIVTGITFEPLGDPGDFGVWTYDAEQNSITRQYRPQIGDEIEIIYDSQAAFSGLVGYMNHTDKFVADGRSTYKLSKPLLRHSGYVAIRR